MLLKFNRDYLDFKKDKQYDVVDTTAKYILAMSIAKEVVDKGGISVPAKVKVAKRASKTITVKTVITPTEKDLLGF